MTLFQKLQKNCFIKIIVKTTSAGLPMNSLNLTDLTIHEPGQKSCGRVGVKEKNFGMGKKFFLLQICENLEGSQKISKKNFFKNAIFSKNLDFQNWF